MNHGDGPRHLSSTEQRFADFGESIAYEQFSGKAAAMVWSRVPALYGKKKWRDSRKCSTRPLKKLRGAGLSHSKTAAIFGWTSRVFNLRAGL